jgi:hypothetical protein
MIKPLAAEAERTLNGNGMSGKLSTDARELICRELSIVGLQETKQDEVLEAIERALGTYFETRQQTKQTISSAEQRLHSIRIQDAVDTLRAAASGADGKTRKRLYLSIAPKKAATDKKRVGKELWHSYVDQLGRAAGHAIARATKKSGRGLKPKDPALRVLVADVGEIWEEHCGQPFHISRKRHPIKPIAAPFRFVNCVLIDIGLSKKPTEVTNLMMEARKEMERRQKMSAESEESEAESDEE